ncbi:unnamed protein product [Acanthosepion pharaonis]|uniref:Uncharacterized protein n=1 Tax=Acanthosepion pharaonis TaxID=158019 RepID=A0A812AY22_ACAPH|nr:unnamed protein product [Sepia pharaonis]
MHPGLADDIQQIDDARKTAQGRPQDDPRQHGVGFAVKNSLIPAIVPPTGGSERILALRLLTSTGFANVLCIYAPMLCATPEVRDQFYEAVDETISRKPNTEGLYLLGDFNARVGDDCDIWHSFLGRQGIGKRNENGQWLLELCCHHGLCVTNTYYKCIEHHKVSWRRPRSRHWHQLDLVITRRADLRSFLHTWSFHRADCDTDHSLGLPRINTCRSKTLRALAASKPPLARRSTHPPSVPLTSTVYSTTSVMPYTPQPLHPFGKKDRRNADWYKTHWDEMQPASEAKRQALLAYKHNPCVNTRDAVRAARSKAQQTACHCANDYWLNLWSKSRRLPTVEAQEAFQGRRGHYRLGQAAGAIVGALPVAVCNPERGDGCRPGCLAQSPSHGGVGCPALCRGTRKNHRLSLLWESPGRDGIPSEMVRSFHEDMHNTVCYNGEASDAFPESSGLKKTNILAQDTASTADFAINGTHLEVVDSFSYLGSTISSSLSLDTEISSRIGKTAAVMEQSN